MPLFPLATEDFLQARQVYKEALKQAEQKGDVASVRHIQEELAELAKRRKGSAWVGQSPNCRCLTAARVGQYKQAGTGAILQRKSNQELKDLLSRRVAIAYLVQNKVVKS